MLTWSARPSSASYLWVSSNTERTQTWQVNNPCFNMTWCLNCPHRYLSKLNKVKIENGHRCPKQVFESGYHAPAHHFTKPSLKAKYLSFKLWSVFCFPRSKTKFSGAPLLRPVCVQKKLCLLKNREWRSRPKAMSSFCCCKTKPFYKRQNIRRFKNWHNHSCE